MAIDPAIQAYFDAWNRRDGAAIVASLTADGTYEDPATRGPLRGDAIAAYAHSLWTAFPDLRFSAGQATGNGVDVAVEWRMDGTNRGAFHGLPPTGRTVSIQGADFIRLADGKVGAVRGYFDSRAVPEQLGLQVVVQPEAIGPFSFGTSTRAWYGSKAVPGAYTVTALTADPADFDAIREQSRQLALEMRAVPGMIAVTLVAVGDRRLTVTAWESSDQARAVLQHPLHQEAMAGFYRKHGVGLSGQVSTLVAVHQGPLQLRCRECGAIDDATRDAGRCRCGAKLPEPPPYW